MGDALGEDHALDVVFGDDRQLGQVKVRHGVDAHVALHDLDAHATGLVRAVHDLPHLAHVAQGHGQLQRVDDGAQARLLAQHEFRQRGLGLDGVFNGRFLLLDFGLVGGIGPGGLLQGDLLIGSRLQRRLLLVGLVLDGALLIASVGVHVRLQAANQLTLGVIARLGVLVLLQMAHRNALQGIGALLQRVHRKEHDKR